MYREILDLTRERLQRRRGGAPAAGGGAASSSSATAPFNSSENAKVDFSLPRDRSLIDPITGTKRRNQPPRRKDHSVKEEERRARARSRSSSSSDLSVDNSEDEDYAENLCDSLLSEEDDSMYGFGGGCFGFSGADCDELMMQGVMPWDDDAEVVLGALYGDHF